MANDRQTSALSSAQYVELSMLRLAAIAIDLRGQLTPHERAKAPSLKAVLDACDALFEELGWGRSGGIAARGGTRRPPPAVTRTS